MTDPDATQPTYEGPLSPRGVRLLKISIAVMSFMIVAALTLITLRVIYLATVPSGNQAAVTRSGSPGASARSTLTESVRLPLPAGAVVRSHALSGDRLTLQYDSPSGGGIAVLDLATGKLLSRVEFVPEIPR